MSRRDENVEIWTEAVEEQLPNWSFTTSVGAIVSTVTMACLIWASILFITTELTPASLLAGDISVTLFSGLVQFSYFTFSMAIAVCLTKYVWYVYQAPSRIASDIDILTPSIIVIFIGGVILVFLSVLDSTLDPDVESIITLYYVTSYGVLGLFGAYITSIRYVKKNELSKDLEQYKEDLKHPTESDIIVLSSATSFNAIATTIITSVVVLLIFHLSVGNLSLIDLLNGNVSVESFVGVLKFVYFIISLGIGLSISIGIWYIYALPDQVASQINLRRVFTTAGLVGGFLIVLAAAGSSFLSVSDRVLNIYYVISYVLMLFVVTAMSSVNFHKEGLGDKLDGYKSDVFEAKKKHKKLIKEYERLQSQAPEAMSVNLESEKLEPFGEPDAEKVFERNAQIREMIEEFRDTIKKHTEITDGLEEIETELDSAATHLSDGEFVTSRERIEKSDSRLAKLDELVSDYNLDGFAEQINDLQQRSDALRSDLDEEAREHLEREIASTQSELAAIETKVEEDNLTDVNETIADIGTRLDSAQETATRLNFEDLYEELESLARRREAVLADIETDMSLDETLSTLDSRLARAESAIEQKELDRASDLLADCDSRLTSVKQSSTASADAQDGFSVEVDEVVQNHQQRYEELSSKLDERRRETLESQKHSIQSDLETARTHLSDGQIADTNEILSDIESRLDSTQEVVSQNEFPDLHNDLRSLAQDCEQLREIVPIVELQEDLTNTIPSQLDEVASLINNEKFTRAFELLTNSRSRVRELDDLIAEFENGPKEKSLNVTEFFDQGPESQYAAIEQREWEYVEAEVRSLQSAFDTVETQIEQREFDQAREAIQEVGAVDRPARQQTATPEPEHVADRSIGQFESRFERIRDVATRAGLDGHQETIDTLEQKHAELNEKVDQLEKWSNEIESLQDELEDIYPITGDDEYDRARAELAEFDTRLDEIENEVMEYETATVETEIATLRQRREELLEEIETAQQREELKKEVGSLRSRLENAQSLIDENSLEQASRVLTEFESEAQSLQTSVARFEELEEELLSLQDRRESMLAEVTTRLENKTVPETIPREPEVSIDYEGLSDKQHIGSGGNADVSKATYQTSEGDSTVAIKEPRVNGTLHTADVERMIEEAQTWDKLDDHDHIVGVVDYGSEPLPWIAMEYMDGGHLGEYTDMDIEQKIWTAYVVTEGVLHAHRRGVAHLDLKPENILFRTVENGWNVPKVSDWGLSKHLLEHSKSIDGLTVEYAAPEQFDDEYGTTDDFTDIYQLGTVFYELFTGEPLYEGQPFTVMNQIINESPTPPTEIADVPPELDKILLTALAKDKNDRYSHVVYLRDALKELVDEF